MFRARRETTSDYGFCFLDRSQILPKWRAGIALWGCANAPKRDRQIGLGNSKKPSALKRDWASKLTLARGLIVPVYAWVGIGIGCLTKS